MNHQVSFRRRVGFSVYEGSFVSVNDQHRQLGGHHKINFPWGRLDVDGECVTLKSPIRTVQIPLDEIDSVQNLLYLSARIRHHCANVPEQVVVWAAWPIFPALQSAIENVTRTIRA